MTIGSPILIDPLWFLGTAALRWIEQPAPCRYVTSADLAVLLLGEFADATAEKCPGIAIRDGVLHLAKGFEFDGASGPAIDGVGNLLAAMVHDALCALKQAGARGYSWAQADRVYRQISVAQGAGRCRAWLHWSMLRGFGWAWRLRG